MESYAGYRYGQRPVALVWRGIRFEIEQVERDWLSRGVLAGEKTGRHFEVRLLSGQLVELLYDELADAWWVRAAPNRP